MFTAADARALYETSYPLDYILDSIRAVAKGTRSTQFKESGWTAELSQALADRGFVVGSGTPGYVRVEW